MPCSTAGANRTAHRPPAPRACRHTDGHGNPIPHWHVLEGRGGAPVAQPINNGSVEFKNLVVNRNTFEVHGVRTRLHTDDQQVIRLMFEAHFFDQSGRIVRVS